MSRPVRAGSRPSRADALVPVSVTRAACSSESHCNRCSNHGGTKSSVLSSANSSRWRLTSWSHQKTSTYLAPRL